MGEQGRTQYADFEGVMLQLAHEEGWEFEYDARSVSVASVFNEATFGPALLQAAQLELAARGISQDLGLILEADEQAMFGKRIRFDDSRSGLMVRMWRLVHCAYQVDMLPRNGNRICLDLVPAVLSPEAGLTPQAQG